MEKFKTLMGIIQDETPAGFWILMLIVSILVGFEYPLIGDIILFLMAIPFGARFLLAVYVWVENVVIEYKRQTGGD